MQTSCVTEMLQLGVKQQLDHVCASWSAFPLPVCYKAVKEGTSWLFLRRGLQYLGLAFCLPQTLS